MSDYDASCVDHMKALTGIISAAQSDLLPTYFLTGEMS